MQIILKLSTMHGRAGVEVAGIQADMQRLYLGTVCISHVQ